MSPQQDSNPTTDAAVLERILEVTRQLARPIDLTTLLGHVIDAGRSVLEAERGTVFLYDPATNELFSKVATGVGEIRVPADKGIVGETAQKRESINVPDCYADPRFSPEADRKSGYRTRCLLSLPLIGHDDSLVGVLQLLNKRGGVFDDADERLASTLAAQCAVALQRARMTEELLVKERLDRELAVAREIQMGILPPSMPELAGYDVAGLSRPAEETGGDTFDLVDLGDQRLMLLLGDATGHGVGPALSVTQMRAMLRIALRLGASLDDTYVQTNDQLAADLAANRFVTAFIGLLDAKTHRVDYHAAGQGPLLHFHAATGECEWLGASTIPLGMLPTLGEPKSRSLELEPGDILGLITDGVYERENRDGDQFEQDGVARIVRQHHGQPMAELGETLLREALAFGHDEPQDDDITIVLARRLRD